MVISWLMLDLMMRYTFLTLERWCVIGVSSDDRVVYSFDKMVEYLVNNGMSDIDAIDWIEYNTLRSIPYIDNRIDGKGKAPIVMYSRDWLGI